MLTNVVEFVNFVLNIAPWRRWSSHRFHNPEFGGSSPSGATNHKQTMKKFYISGQKSETIEENIAARDRIEAAMMFKFKYPSFVFWHVGEDIIIGWCESSGVPIFRGDEYETDEHGIMVLMKPA